MTFNNKTNNNLIVLLSFESLLSLFTQKKSVISCNHKLDNGMKFISRVGSKDGFGIFDRRGS